MGDVTPNAHFTSSDPSIATVDDKGIVRAHADGTATITATIDTDHATTLVRVEKAAIPSDLSFRNHIMPLLTKVGCNSGACHGALAGKGGLKLSLRGYDPEADHFVLTRQALGRRIDKLEPAQSLMLLKPTLAVAARRRSQASRCLRRIIDVLADWIAAGAPGLSAEDPRIQTAGSVPARRAVLKPKDRLQDRGAGVVLRRPRRGRDARWPSSTAREDLVAGVDDKGMVQ